MGPFILQDFPKDQFLNFGKFCVYTKWMSPISLTPSWLTEKEKCSFLSQSVKKEVKTTKKTFQHQRFYNPVFSFFSIIFSIFVIYWCTIFVIYWCTSKTCLANKSFRSSSPKVFYEKVVRRHFAKFIVSIELLAID